MIAESGDDTPAGAAWQRCPARARVAAGGGGLPVHGIAVPYCAVESPAVELPRGRTVGVAQSVRAPDCGSGGRRFESGRPPWGDADRARTPGWAAGRGRHGRRLRPPLLTSRPGLPTVRVYRVSSVPSRPATGHASLAGPRRAAPVFGRLRPPLIFDNRGHEKRAGPSPASTVSRRSSSGPAASRNGREGSINADSEHRIHADPRFIRAISSYLSWRV